MTVLNRIISDATHIQGVYVTPSALVAGQNSVYDGTNLVAADPGTQLTWPSNVPIGSVAYGSLGTDSVNVAGTIYYAEFPLAHRKVVTNVNLLNGSTAGTDKNIAAIWDTSGTLLGTSALAGITASGTDAFQQLPLIAALTLLPGRYFVGYQCNGTTTKVRKIAASTFLNLRGSATGAFGTIGNITVPTTAATDKGCFAYFD